MKYFFLLLLSCASLHTAPNHETTSLTVEALEGGEVDVEAVESNLALAREYLSQYWRPFVDYTPLTIRVHAQTTWMDPDLGKVAGLTWVHLGVMEVGPDGEVLLHELAHLMYWRLSREDSSDHEGWDTNGINVAELAYLADKRLRPILKR